MGAGHGLYRPGTTPVHRLPGEVKIAASVTFTIAVVATPRQAAWAFGCYALLLIAVMATARITPLWLAGRSLIEVPFVALAVLLPFMEGGPYTAWLGLEVSVPGSWGAFNIVAKATLGVWASLTLAATTDATALLAGLNRLRCPAVITQLAAFMVRYVHVLSAQARQMRVARVSRGDDPRFLWQLKGYATGVGVLFLRSFERGERVYVAMLSRGYNGQMPLGAGYRSAAAADWATAALLPVAAGAIAVTAIML